MAETLQSRRVHFSDFEVNLRSGELRKCGRKVRLQEKPFQILALLLEQPGELVAREEMRQKLWPADTFVDFDHSLGTAISKLRLALGDSPQNPRFIETVASRGYRFIAPTESVNGTLSRPAVVTGEPVAKLAPAKGAPGANLFRRWIASSVAGLMGGALLVAILLGFDIGGAREWLRTESDRPVHSLAVLPLSNPGADGNTEYLGDGIAETLINRLSQVPSLKVMSRDSSFRYRGREADAQTIGHALGVDAIFKGTVRQRGDSLEVSTELIDSRDNTHIWGEHYTRKESEMFGLSEEIGNQVSAVLRIRLPGVSQKRQTESYAPNPEAYLDYLRGRYFWDKRSEEGYNTAVEYFQKAIAKDPTYALAYAGLADCYRGRAHFGFVGPNEAYPKAKEAALKALELDDTLAEAHASLGIVKAQYDLDRAGGERELRRAIELNPNYSIAHLMYGTVLGEEGRSEEALAQVKQAFELDPLSLGTNRALAISFYGARQYEKAIEQQQKTLELDPNSFLARDDLGWMFVQNGMYGEAIAEFDSLLARSPENTDVLSGLGLAYARAKRKSDARNVLAKLNDLSKRKFVPGQCPAVIYAGLGEKDRAFEWLEKAYEQRSVEGLGDPVYDSLRSDPRFHDLERRIGITP
jgi:TolB-like protein/DNA-binding winged helix-turn-helix (wHTH) protein/Flp pilus assembly protein TadD